MSQNSTERTSVVVSGTSDASREIVSNYDPSGTAVDQVMGNRRQVRARVAKLERLEKLRQAKPRP